MLKNYLKIAFRNLVRNKAYSVINISGLVIGMVSSILIFLWVENELSYDRFHRNADRICRLVCNAGDFKAAVSPAGMGEGLQRQMPEIAAVVRVSKPSTNLLEVGDRKFEEKNGFYADSNFLQVFSFPLVRGNAATALQHPDGILITENLAKKYFGKEDALGKVIRADNRDPFTVTGVLANIPANSHLQFDFIIPISSVENKAYDLKNKAWGNFNFYTYLQFREHTDLSPAGRVNLNRRILAIYKPHNPDFKIDFQLQPLTSIHLHSDLQIDVSGQGNIQYVHIFFIVALVILAVACINFMNLATARSARRAKEVGLRKVVGAERYELVLQFLGESLLLSFLSLLIAIGLVVLLLPAFNDLAGKKLAVRLLDGKLLAGLLGIACLTGLISGSYPALFLSGFQPIKVLKGKMRLGGGNLLFRNTLVVTQFVTAIILLAGTTVVYKQLNFIKSKNLGFEKANLVYLPMTGDMWNKQEALQAALQQDPLTSDYSIVSDLPLHLSTGTINVQWEGKDPKSQVVIPSIDVDENFLRVFRIKMVSGRAFSAGKNDSSNYIVNETALQVMGMDPDRALGKTLRFSGTKGTIIGIVKDFNFKPLQYAIEPLVLRSKQYSGGIAVIRAPAGNTAASIKALGKISRELNPAYPFSYNFLDQDLAQLYQGEQQMGKLFNLFAALSIFISCLGLYGLSAFMAEQRTKEIGVRKVLGASVFKIVYLLSTGFTRLILIAVVIAIPVSWMAIHSWLEGFAYHIEVNAGIFLLASGIALLIAWFTVSYESIKAGIANPVKSLRNE